MKLTIAVVMLSLCLGPWPIAQPATNQAIVEGSSFSASVWNPANSAQRLHVELVKVAIPEGKAGRVTFEVFQPGNRPYWEQAMIVYQSIEGTSLSEYMRWGTEKNNRQKEHLSLEGGRTYVFAAWHLPGPAGAQSEKLPWTPSHCRLVRASDGYTVESDDGEAGTNGGDHNFRDIVAHIVIK